LVEEVWIEDDEIVVKESIFYDRIPKQRVKDAITKTFNQVVPKHMRIDTTGLKISLLNELGL